jgi:hypothetical protein
MSDSTTDAATRRNENCSAVLPAPVRSPAPVVECRYLRVVGASGALTS